MADEVVRSSRPPAESSKEAQIGRRNASRQQVCVPAKLRIGAATADVVITDISATGARLHLPAPPPVGRTGILSWDDLECPAQIAWAGPNSCGIAFDPVAAQSLAQRISATCLKAPVAVSPAPTTTPQPWLAQAALTPRRAIERPAEVRQGDAWTKVVLRSISQHGFEIGWFPRCREQAPISLRGPGLPLLHGRVVASDRVRVTCKLRTPLHDAVLLHITERLGIGT